MKKLLSPGLILGLLAVGFLWLRAHDARVKADALADARADSIQVAYELLEQVHAERDSINALRELEKAELRDSMTTQRTRMYRSQASAAELRDSVQALLAADCQVPENLFVALVDNLSAGLEACDEALGNCDEITEVQGLQLVARDSTIAELTEGRQSLVHELGVANRRANPGFFKRLEMSFPFVAFFTGALAVVAAIW
jgi:hypothetical protein